MTGSSPAGLRKKMIRALGLAHMMTFLQEPYMFRSALKMLKYALILIFKSF
uniref:Uncharacterized protein n=1 Tax=Arundo donax TaxID=35708 RepID=A0A0A9E0L9_ARUDO